jgi:outer membrane receptor for ferrienterochelin and colicins
MQSWFMPSIPPRLLLSLFTATARAQEAAPPVEGPLQTVEIKASAGSYDARRDDTATKIVVTQEEIVKFGDTTLGDVLKRLPGVTIGGAPGRASDIRLRGLGSGYTQVLLNGEPAPPGFSLDSLDPGLVERIEILRAATAEFSTQAIAGTINIVLKRAIVASQREIRSGVRSEHGQPGTNLNVQLSDRAGAVSYAIGGGAAYNLQHRSSRGVVTFLDPAGVATTRRHEAGSNEGLYRGVNVAPRVTVNLGPNDSVTSQSFLNATRYTGPWRMRTTTLTGALPRFPASDGAVADATGAARTDVAWTHKMAGSAKVELKAGANRTMRSNEQASRNQDAGDNVVLNRQVAARTRDQGWTASGKLTTSLGDAHAFTGGWDGARSQRGESRSQREQSATGAPVANLDQPYDGTLSRFALFAQDEWTIDKQWSGYFGVRWEGLRMRSVATAGTQVDTQFDNTARVWSPLFQALYKLPGAPGNQLRLALTRTWKAPTFRMLNPRRVEADDNTPTTPATQGNPYLRPELATGLDLAFEHFIAGGGLLSASGYLRRIRDNTRDNTVLVEGAWVSMPVNTGAARMQGIELEAKFPLRAWCAWCGNAPAIDVRANLARNWSRQGGVLGPDNRLAGQTPFSATLGIDYKAARLPLTLGGSFSFQSGGPVRSSASEFDYARPKRVLDLVAVVRLTARHQLRLSVANALHQEHMTATTWADGAGALSDAAFTPTSTVFRAVLELKL